MEDGRTYTNKRRTALNPERIKRLREKLRISQSSLAKIIGTSKRNVENWEQGSREPNEENERRLLALEKE